MVILAIVLLLVGAYLCGSVPTGFLVAKGAKGIDIRDYGSGGTGATNVLRTVGKEAALIVFLIDLGKGLLAVLLVRAIFPDLLAAFPDSSLTPDWQPWLEMSAGLLALVGHSRSIWLGFTGGKSVAAGLGVLFALAWTVALAAMGIFAITLTLSRIVSLSSIGAALGTIVLMVVTGQPLAYISLVVLGGVYVIVRHRSNIQRLWAGTEPRLGQSTTKA
ncbi:MAG: glycerol-3-phosphate 1-O-acyltransferase PlsY [Leptolyngbyaceae cyanobacterium SM2_3_12]|nr:glycerol-3-phosphate 1-O-acyltransferase PlsY [Leptolyngbyaceae cyanobacterium SM2_3_12]